METPANSNNLKRRRKLLSILFEHSLISCIMGFSLFFCYFALFSVFASFFFSIFFSIFWAGVSDFHHSIKTYVQKSMRLINHFLLVLCSVFALSTHLFNAAVCWVIVVVIILFFFFIQFLLLHSFMMNIFFLFAGAFFYACVRSILWLCKSILKTYSRFAITYISI